MGVKVLCLLLDNIILDLARKWLMPKVERDTSNWQGLIFFSVLWTGNSECLAALRPDGLKSLEKLWVSSAHPSSPRPVLGHERGRNIQSAQHIELGHVKEKRSHNSDFNPCSIAICLLHRFFDRVGERELVLSTKEDWQEKKTGTLLGDCETKLPFSRPRRILCSSSYCLPWIVYTRIPFLGSLLL